MCLSLWQIFRPQVGSPVGYCSRTHNRAVVHFAAGLAPEVTNCFFVVFLLIDWLPSDRDSIGIREEIKKKQTLEVEVIQRNKKILY